MMERKEIFKEWQRLKSNIDSIAAAVQNEESLSKEQLDELKDEIIHVTSMVRYLGRETILANRPEYGRPIISIALEEMHKLGLTEE